MDFEPTDLTEQELADVNPVAVVLMACLADAVNDLARLHRMGAWKDSPAEIGPWLRTKFGHGSQQMGHTKSLAVWEWMLWDGRWNEALCENLEAEVGLVMDPLRIVRLAQKRSAMYAGKARASHVFQSTRGRMGGCKVKV